MEWNEVTTVPESISKLTNLGCLELGNNSIVKIDDKLADLRMMTRCNFSNNCLSDFPVSACNLTF